VTARSVRTSAQNGEHVTGVRPTVVFPEVSRGSARRGPQRRPRVRSGYDAQRPHARLPKHTAAALARSAVSTGLLVIAIVVVAELWRANGLTVGPRLPSAIALLVAFQLLGLRVFRVHRRSWRFTGLTDVLAITSGLTLGTVAYSVTDVVADRLGMAIPPATAALPQGLLLAALLLAINLTVIARIARRIQGQSASGSASRRTGRRDRTTDAASASRAPEHRALVLGAGRVAVGVVRDASLHHGVPPRIVGLLDDATRPGELVAGAPVLGRVIDLEHIARTHDATLLIIALEHPEPALLREVIVRAQRLGLVVRIRPAEPLAGLDREALVVRDLDLGDLLARPTAVMDGEGSSV
jgi:FlaA1/EpsC-like NDP-sugar epimerase